MKRSGQVLGILVALSVTGVLVTLALGMTNTDAPVPTVQAVAGSSALDSARGLAWDLQGRTALHYAVVLLQIVGISALALWRLAPATRWADTGRLSFGAAVAGLGLAGTCCAWYRSELTLFAGGSMAVLLTLACLATESGAVPHVVKPSRGSSGQ